MRLTEDEVKQIRADHKAILARLNYPSDIVCELSTVRERWFPPKYREPVIGTYRKPRF